MGSFKNNTTLYTITITCGVILLFAFMVNSSGQKLGSLFQSTPDSDISESAQGLEIPSSQYTTFKLNKENNTSSSGRYKNDYQASATYARTYVNDSDNQGTSSSTKFVEKKKAETKKAKKRSKKNIAKKKNIEKSKLKKDSFFDDEDSLGSSGNNYASSGGGTTGPAKAPQKKKDEEEQLNTVQYWEKPIFVEEDFKAVLKLISSYQVKKVSGGVFYTLVDDMTHDERPTLRSYGLIALTSTPSTKSFSELAWLKHNDDVNDIRSSAGNEISNYADLGRISYVVSALRINSKSEPKTTLEALSIVSEATKKYSSIKTNSGSSRSTSSSQVAQLIPRLDTALAIIQEKYINSSDPQIKNEASKTAAAIKSYTSL
ncbi:MAG: hypothetical protein H6623_06390 [Bdellovibrionaceae bacterium]|nr:hypothetical protein [Pseudobdellovibrionaceae bacterium]